MAKSSSKRKPTTKKSRRKDRAAPVVRQTKKQIAFGKKEARQNRIIWLSVGALGLLILAVLTVGLVQEFLIKPGRPVAIVNGAKIPTDVYQDLVTYQRYNQYANIRNLENTLKNMDPNQEGNEFLTAFYEQQLRQLQSNLALTPQTALDELIDDELIQEKAQELGITVTAAEVEQTIMEDLRRAVSPPPQQPITDTEQLPTPTPVPQAQLDKYYQTILDNMGLTDKSFRAIVHRSLLRQKVQEQLASQSPTTGLVARAQLIQTDTQEEALAAQARIENGEDFALVAQEVSTDTLTAEKGGDLGWVTVDQLTSRYGQEVDNAIFDMEVGEIRLVESNGQFYVVQVVDRDENGPLPPEVLSLRQNSALRDWLEAYKASPEVEIERLLQPDQIPPDPFAAP